MKIVHVVYSCHPGEFRGGVPKVVYELSRAQVDLGHQVTIYTTNYNSSVPVDVPLDRVIESAGVKIRHFPVTQPRWFQSPELRQVLLASAANYDVIHSHNIFLALNLYAAEAHRASGKPLFYHVHGSLDPRVVNKGMIKRVRKQVYIRLLERRNYNTANGIFAFSPTEVAQIRHYGIRSPIHLAPNGIWPNTIQNNADGKLFRKQFGISPDKEIILYLGRIIPKKGLHLLIKAFSELRQTFSDVVLVIVGDRKQDPVYVNTLDRLIAQGGVAPAVFWPGFLNENEKYRAFAAAAIFSHASESEGMAISILEAMAMGLPTVISKQCYMPEAAKAGAVVECDYNAESLQSTLTHLLADVEARTCAGRIAYDYVRRHHSWLRVAEDIVQVYGSAS